MYVSNTYQGNVQQSYAQDYQSNTARPVSTSYQSCSTCTGCGRC